MILWRHYWFVNYSGQYFMILFVLLTAPVSRLCGLVYPNSIDDVSSSSSRNSRQLVAGTVPSTILLTASGTSTNIGIHLQLRGPQISKQPSEIKKFKETFCDPELELLQITIADLHFSFKGFKELAEFQDSSHMNLQISTMNPHMNPQTSDRPSSVRRKGDT